MQFSYRAIDSQGRVENGKIIAESREQLGNLFKAKGKVLVEVKEVTRWTLIVARRKFTSQERLNFTQQMAGLLESGIPIERALAILGRLSTVKETVELINKITQSLQEGLSFTAALELFGQEFSTFYINMVRAGETGGILSEVLTRLAQYLEEEMALERFIIGSLIYPSIIVATSIAALIFFVNDIIPKFQEIFEGFGSELPLITQIVMFCGAALTQYGWLLLLGCIGGVLGYFKTIATPQGKFFFDRLMLQLPLIGDIHQKAVIAKMAMALSLLEQSGVPLLTGLQISAEIMDNGVFTRALHAVEQEVKRGHTLAQSMENQQVFPMLAIEMISVGEESGQLSRMLGKVAKTYEGEVKNAIGVFLTVFEPLLILLMVGLIAILAVAILLPIINMNAKMG